MKIFDHDCELVRAARAAKVWELSYSDYMLWLKSLPPSSELQALLTGRYALHGVEDENGQPDVVLWKRCELDGCLALVCHNISDQYCWPHSREGRWSLVIKLFGKPTGYFGNSWYNFEKPIGSGMTALRVPDDPSEPLKTPHRDIFGFFIETHDKRPNPYIPTSGGSKKPGDERFRFP